MVGVCRLCKETHDVNASCPRFATAQTPVVGHDAALVGHVVADRYRLGEVIGAGTTGAVFAAEHVSFGRAAAVKVLRPRFADAELVSRVVQRDARAAWSVTHPCLCEVFDVGALPDGAPFFVMERLEGETLATRIARERLSLGAAIDVMMQLLSAIAAIHRRDLLLRDLRPQNIYLVYRRGCRPLVKILDFGLARLTPYSSTAPHYLSPERTRGEHAVEPASDLFVAAAIFYESLAGERAFAADSWNEVVALIEHGGHVALSEHRPEVSPDLSAFVTRALSPAPRFRPASAKEMQDELRSLLARGSRRAISASLPVSSDAHPVYGVSSDAHPVHAADVEERTVDDRVERTLRVPPPRLPRLPSDGEETKTVLLDELRKELDATIAVPPKHR